MPEPESSELDNVCSRSIGPPKPQAPSWGYMIMSLIMIQTVSFFAGAGVYTLWIRPHVINVPYWIDLLVILFGISIGSIILVEVYLVRLTRR